MEIVEQEGIMQIEFTHNGVEYGLQQVGEDRWVMSFGGAVTDMPEAAQLLAKSAFNNPGHCLAEWLVAFGYRPIIDITSLLRKGVM